MIDAIRARGADVWVVFDSCHSGTATRAAPGAGEVRMRQLPPDALAIPAGAMAEAASRSRALPDPRSPADAPVEAVSDDGETGRLVAFFAAQTNETTPERNMPKGQANRRIQGVFTYTLFETLAERPGITYRQLAQEVLRKYVSGNLARSTPLFEGDLDLPVFGQGAGDLGVPRGPLGVQQAGQWGVVGRGGAVHRDACVRQPRTVGVRVQGGEVHAEVDGLADGLEAARFRER